MTNIRGERRVVIQAPIEEVFNYVSDFSRHHEWNQQIVEITKVSDGPVGVGSRFRAKERPPSNLPLPMKLLFPLMTKAVGMAEYTEAEITDWEPNKTVAWKAAAPLRGGGMWMRTASSLEFETQNGATRVTQHFHYIPEHDRAKKGMSEEKATKLVDEGVSRNLGQLRSLLESRSGARTSV